MEININCDLGEKSKHHSNENDPKLLDIVNSASIACGYHAGDEATMKETIDISVKKGVSFGAHPSFKDPENFGRKRINLSSKEIKELIINQFDILQKIADEKNQKVTHIKPHGALNNMACEDIELSNIISKTIYEINRDLIYLVPTGSKMEISANNYNLKVASEIFADRNYLDNGNLVSRKDKYAVITDPNKAKDHVLFMVKNQALRCLSGKQISCKIDSICIHGDTESALDIAKLVKDSLIKSGFNLKPLNKMSKFGL